MLGLETQEVLAGLADLSQLESGERDIDDEAFEREIRERFDSRRAAGSSDGARRDEVRRQRRGTCPPSRLLRLAVPAHLPTLNASGRLREGGTRPPPTGRLPRFATCAADGGGGALQHRLRGRRTRRRIA